MFVSRKAPHGLFYQLSMFINYTWEDNRQFLILFFANLAIETTNSGISYQRRDINSIWMFARMLLYINGKFTVKQI
jgi:hypothetical protein